MSEQESEKKLSCYAKLKNGLFLLMDELDDIRCDIEEALCFITNIIYLYDEICIYTRKIKSLFTIGLSPSELLPYCSETTDNQGLVQILVTMKSDILRINPNLEEFCKVRKISIGEIRFLKDSNHFMRMKKLEDKYARHLRILYRCFISSLLEFTKIIDELASDICVCKKKISGIRTGIVGELKSVSGILLFFFNNENELRLKKNINKNQYFLEYFRERFDCLKF